MTMPMFVSTKNDLIEVATRILFEIDPAKTYCVECEVENEYENEAALLAEYFVDANMMLKTAMLRTFKEQFGEGNYDEARLNKAYRKINDYML